jgi:hypothetical protein
MLHLFNTQPVENSMNYTRCYTLYLFCGLLSVAQVSFSMNNPDPFKEKELIEQDRKLKRSWYSEYIDPKSYDPHVAWHQNVVTYFEELAAQKTKNALLTTKNSLTTPGAPLHFYEDKESGEQVYSGKLGDLYAAKWNKETEEWDIRVIKWPAIDIHTLQPNAGIINNPGRHIKRADAGSAAGDDVHRRVTDTWHNAVCIGLNSKKKPIVAAAKNAIIEIYNKTRVIRTLDLSQFNLNSIADMHFLSPGAFFVVGERNTLEGDFYKEIKTHARELLQYDLSTNHQLQEPKKINLNPKAHKEFHCDPMRTITHDGEKCMSLITYEMNRGEWHEGELIAAKNGDQYSYLPLTLTLPNLGQLPFTAVRCLPELHERLLNIDTPIRRRGPIELGDVFSELPPLLIPAPIKKGSIYENSADPNDGHPLTPISSLIGAVVDTTDRSKDPEYILVPAIKKWVKKEELPALCVATRYLPSFQHSLAPTKEKDRVDLRKAFVTAIDDSLAENILYNNKKLLILDKKEYVITPFGAIRTQDVNNENAPLEEVMGPLYDQYKDRCNAIIDGDKYQSLSEKKVALGTLMASILDHTRHYSPTLVTHDAIAMYHIDPDNINRKLLNIAQLRNPLGQKEKSVTIDITNQGIIDHFDTNSTGQAAVLLTLPIPDPDDFDNPLTLPKHIQVQKQSLQLVDFSGNEVQTISTQIVGTNNAPLAKDQKLTRIFKLLPHGVQCCMRPNNFWDKIWYIFKPKVQSFYIKDPQERSNTLYESPLPPRYVRNFSGAIGRCWDLWSIFRGRL